MRESVTALYIAVGFDTHAVDRHLNFCDSSLANREIFQILWPERDMVPPHGEATQAQMFDPVQLLPTGL
jgi:hypothetical protein